MNTENKILLTIELDEEATEKRVVAIRKSLEQLDNVNKQLAKDYKEGAIDADEYYKAQEKIKRGSNELTKELAQQRKALENLDKSNKAQKGSLIELRANLSNATAAYAALSKEQRENANVGGALKNTIKGYSDELKEAEEALGDHRRSVGDYAKGLNIAGVNVGEFGEALKSGGKDALVMVKGIGSISGALKLLMAIPIILFITGLIAFFKSTDEGADRLEQGIAALSAGFDALMRAVAPLGKILVDTFLHPIDAAGKLAEAIKHPIDSYNKLRDGANKMGEEAANAWSIVGKAAEAYTRRMQNVEDAENALIAQRARVGKQVDEALLKQKDRSLSTQEQIRLLKEAGKAEAALAAAQVKAAREAYEAILSYNISRQRANQTLKDDEVKAQLEAEAAYINAQRESANTQQNIQNRLSAREEEIAAEAQKRRDKAKEARKAALAEEVALAELALAGAKKRNVELISYEEALIKAKLKASLFDAKGANQRKLLVAQAEAEIAKLRVDAAIATDTRLNGITVANLQARLALVKKGTGVELLLTTQLLQAQAKAERDNINLTVKNREERASKIKLVDAKLAADLEDAQKQHIANLLQQEQERQDKLQKMREQGLARFQSDQKKIRTKERQAAELDLIQAEEDSREAYEAKRKIAEQNYREEHEAAGTNYELQKIAEANYLRELGNLRDEWLKKQADIVAGTLQATTDAVGSLLEALSQRQLNDLDRQQEAATKSAGNNALIREAIEKRYQKRRAELEKEAAIKRKRIASVENVIAGLQAGTTALISFAKNPILGAITLGLVAVKTIANQIAIDSQKFARGGVPLEYNNTYNYVSNGAGGYVRGAGTPTSDTINAKISTQESVINAAGTAKYFDELSYINSSTGGKAFPGAKRISSLPPIKPAFRYGIIGAGNTDSAQAIERAVERGIAKIQPTMILEDLNQLQGNRQRIANRTTITTKQAA